MIRRSLIALSLVAFAAGPALAEGPAFPPASSFPALGQAPKVELVNPGKGKRAALRWKAEKGASGKMSMSMATDMEIGVAGETMPMNMTMRMDMDGKVLDVTADGSSVVSMMVTDAGMTMPGLEEAGGEAATMIRDMLKGLVIEATMDARGAITKSEVKGGSDMVKALAGQMDSSFEQMAVPFPEEPVAIGATWRAYVRQVSNGMNVQMVSTYKLVKLEGSQGTVEVTIAQQADAQTMDMNGTKAELEALASTGTGKMSFDLRRPMFAEAQVALDMNARMKVQGQSATLKIKAKVAMTPGAAK